MAPNHNKYHLKALQRYRPITANSLKHNQFQFMELQIIFFSAPTAPQPPNGLRCKVWENVGKRGCVCKMPFQCPWVWLSRIIYYFCLCYQNISKMVRFSPNESSFRASLQLCIRVASQPTARLLGVCQLGALRCLGRSFTLTSDRDCDWSEETFTSCDDCKPGTICQGICNFLTQCNLFVTALVENPSTCR